MLYGGIYTLYNGLYILYVSYITNKPTVLTSPNAYFRETIHTDLIFQQVRL